jgi:uncharacterized protein
MHTGSLKVKLILRQARSLKDKRQVVRSIMERLKNGFNVAVSEVEARDEPQYAVLGMATVADDAQTVRTTLQHMVDALKSHPVAEFVSAEMEDFAPNYE